MWRAQLQVYVYNAQDLLDNLKMKYAFKLLNT